MDSRGAAVLFSEMTPGAEFEAEFNRWYDEEHIPIRMRCEGFIGAQRYRAEDAPNYLAVYELADLGVLSSDAYKAIKDHPSERTAWMLAHVSGFTRYLGREISGVARSAPVAPPIDAPLIYAVFFNVPPDGTAEFDAWYETEHVPMLMECSDWLMVRRFEIVEGVPKPFTRLALHYLADAKALSSPERERARVTDWRNRLAKNDWFKGSYSVFRRQGQRRHAAR
jgi:hypothetical protein